MAHELTTSYLQDSIGLFRYYKKMGESALAQCPDAGLFTLLDKDANSIAIIVKAYGGKYAVAVDELFDHRRRETGSRSRQRV